jgi:hypothetical protein
MPTGRWEGTYQSADTLIAARLEIDPKGSISVSAPDAMNTAGAERAVLKANLARDLAASWGRVQPRKMDFDGKVFRNPGGMAPQIEWDPDSHAMQLVIYLGTRPGIRVPLRAVKDFSADPWNP